MIKLLEKEPDEEKYFDDQWSHVVSDFSKKASIDIYIEESRDCGKNIFLLGKRSWLAKMLEREAELENHPLEDDPFLYTRNFKIIGNTNFPFVNFVERVIRSY